MKVTINHQEINLTPSDIENLSPTFTFLHGRRFAFQPINGNGFRNISLNGLILAIKKEAFNPEQDKNEIKDFLRVFKAIKDKGYETPNCQINKEDFLTRIITKIKHFFSETPRNALFKELDQVIGKANSKIIIPERSQVPQQTVPFEKNEHQAVTVEETQKNQAALKNIPSENPQSNAVTAKKETQQESIPNIQKSIPSYIPEEQLKPETQVLQQTVPFEKPNEHQDATDEAQKNQVLLKNIPLENPQIDTVIPKKETQQATTPNIQKPISSYLPEDKTKAEKLFNLGHDFLYYKQDRKQAEKYLLEAAKLGNTLAKTNLGMLYAFEKNYSMSNEWLIKAANEGEVEAQFGLAMALEGGQGINRDLKQALYWYKRSYESEPRFRAGAAKMMMLGIEQKLNELI